MSTATADPIEDVEEIVIQTTSAPCECDHGSEDEYVPCGNPASFRMIFDCDCEDENHGKTVLLFCEKCKDTYLSRHGASGVTVLPL